MERFIIKDEKYDNIVMRLYYSDIDEAQRKHPGATIMLDTDIGYLDAVEKIKALSVEKFCDYRGREIWKIPHNNAFILYRQFVDEEGNYIDGCSYQRWDNVAYVAPFSWNITNPGEFVKLFIKEVPRQTPSIGSIEVASIQILSPLGHVLRTHM